MFLKKVTRSFNAANNLAYKYALSQNALKIHGELKLYVIKISPNLISSCAVAILANHAVLSLMPVSLY